jgi:delta24-sterol reductase
LHHILSLDTVNLTITVEPLVSVQEAADFLVPRGYILASHLEYGRATLGGLAMAVGMTTHAHITGLFQETVEAYEVVLATGERLTATASNEHSDLFFALPWSHGTLCTLVSLTLKVLPCKPYVRLKYLPVTGLENIAASIRAQSGALDPAQKGVPAFVEATLFSLDKAVLTVTSTPEFHSLHSKP